MNKLVLSTFLILSCYVVQGQTGTGEKPLSWAANIPALRSFELAQKQMPTLDMQRIEAEDRQRKTAGEPLRFGYRHDVNFTLENSGEWTDAPDGGRLWRLEIACPGALAVSMLYDRFWLPAGAKFWVYTSDRKRSIGAFTSANNNGEPSDMRGFATASIAGSRVVLEYYLPKEADETGVISISSVIHVYLYLPFLGIEPPPGYRANPDLCNHVSVECAEAQPWWNHEKKAVALIVCGNEAIGTGALINNTNEDGRPLFLTAYHVYQYNKFIDEYIFYWNYDGSCGIYYDDYHQHSNDFTTTGAKSILASYSGSDFILLELKDNFKNNKDITPYYLGWNRGSPGTGGAGIHHPLGVAKKIAIHSMTPVDNGCFGNNFWRVQWDKSIVNGIYATQNVSSGSPLLGANNLVIGQLYGKCDVDYVGCDGQENHHSNYGKLSKSWEGDKSLHGRLSDYLHPIAGAAPDYLAGRGAKNISINGPGSLIAGSSSDFTVNSPPVSYEWDWSSNLSAGIISGHKRTFTANSTGAAWVCIRIQIAPNEWYEIAKYNFNVTGNYSISGPAEVSYPAGATYTLVNPPSGAGTIYWTISHSGFFNVPSSGNPISINISGPGAGYNTLSARTGSTSGTVIATKTITQTTALVGPDKFCFDGQYNLYGASAISWSVSPSSPIMSISSSTSNSATVTSNYFSGQTGTLTAIIGSQSQVVTKNIAACAATIAGPPFICDTETYFLSFGQATGWSIQQNGSVFSIVSSSVNTVTVSASSTNGETGALIATMPGGSVQIPIKASCGKSSASSYVTAYPNPVNVILTVDVDAAAGQFASGFGRQAPTFDVRLYDGQGNMLRQTTAKGGTVQFNVSNLLNGMYYLLIYDDAGSKPIMETIMVEH